MAGRPQLDPEHRRILIAIVAESPPENRGVIRRIHSPSQTSSGLWAHPQMPPGGARSIDPVEIHHLRYLAQYGLIDLSNPSGEAWDFVPLPAGDAEVELLREEVGQPTPTQQAVRRGEALDGRYLTFGRRVANVLVFLPALVITVAALLASQVGLILPGVSLAIGLPAAVWAVWSALRQRSPFDVARGLRDGAATWIANVVRRLVEG